MSTFNDIDIECTQCGEEYRGAVWVAIHAGEDPELKDLLQGGELNLVACPECSFVEFQERFLIYQEPAAELVAYVYPEAQKEREGELRAGMLTGFNEAQETMPKQKRLDYEPLLFFGLASLIELLENEDALAKQSQVAQAICKQHNLGMVLLSPTQARRRSTVRVLPRTGSETTPSRADVLQGIDRLLEINPVLDFYETLREKIKADAEWSLA